VLGALAGVGVHWRNTGHSEDLPVSNRPARVAPEPHLQREALVGARRQAAAATVARFLDQAVRGSGVGATWDLVTPSFRQGFTRAQWQRGVTPIVPYRYATYEVAVVDAYVDRLELAVRTYPPKRSTDAVQTFALELTRAGSGARQHWLVNYWEPKAPDTQPSSPLSARATATSGKGELGAEWLLLPVALVGGALLVLAGLGARGWYRSSRASRAYRAERERSLFS
jgi:hypothetical protein